MNNGIYFAQIVKELKRIADALEESNTLVKDLGGYHGK